MRSSKPAPERNNRLHFTWDDRVPREGPQAGKHVACLVSTFNPSLMVTNILDSWCADNVGTSGVDWLRVTALAWWFARRSDATLFLLRWHRVDPLEGAKIKLLTDNQNSVDSNVFWYSKDEWDEKGIV